MKKLITILLLLTLCGCQSQSTPLSDKRFCLDTIVEITLYDSNSSFTFVQTLIKCIISSFYMCFVIDYPHNPIRS